MRGNQMSDGGGRGRDVKPSNAIFDGAITHADALMLPQMLHQDSTTKLST